jgi:hypothetical protein
MDQHMGVKLGIAQGTGKLDLSEMGLTHIPPQVFSLTGLTVRRPTATYLHSHCPKIHG